MPIKKKWLKPNLTILVKKSPSQDAERVLAGCKALGPYYTNPGPYIQVDMCYNQVVCEYKLCGHGVQNYCGEGFCSDLTIS